MNWLYMLKSAMIFVAVLIPFSGSALAADTPEQRSKRAQKILSALKMFGIADAKVNYLVVEAESHIEKDGYFYLADHQMEDGRLALRFEAHGMPQMKQLQLSYVPKDTHYAFTASTRGVMFNYHYEFK